MTPSISKIDQDWVINGLPMPPPSNNLYVTDRNSGRRFPSKDLKNFKMEMDTCHMVMKRQLAPMVRDIFGWIENPGTFVRIDRYFFFPYEQLYLKTKRFAPKTMDGSNRIKALDDAIAKLTTLDDKFFWCGLEEKVELEETGERPFSMVRLSQFQGRRADEILQRLSASQAPRESAEKSGYLVRQLKRGEGMEIGEGAIRIVVSRLNLGSVSLAVRAPKDIRITTTHRGEREF